MRLYILIAALVVCAFHAQRLQAHPPANTVRYPRVFGATGRPYGPTQAHYQYERRYGRPWHGQGGAVAGYRSANYLPRGYYPRGGYGWGFRGSLFGSYYGCARVPFFTPSLSVNITSPFARPRYPNTAQPSPEVYNNDVLRDTWLESQRRWQTPLDAESLPKIAPNVVTPSTPEATQRSIRAQARGDEWFRQQQYSQAHERYEHAILLAEDRAVAWFRKAFALAALGQYQPAARTLRRGLEIDLSWPAKGESLDDLYGSENVLAKTALLQRVGSWVREDVRDPDRLFLMGVLLHFDGQRDKSPVFFEAALRLAGYGDHLMAFLQPTEIGPAQPQVPSSSGGQSPALPGIPSAPPQELPPAPQSPPAGSGVELPVPPVPSEAPPRPGSTGIELLPSVPADPDDPVDSGPALLAPGL